MKFLVKIIPLCVFFSASAFALANPAATNCTQKGYRYLLVQNVGVCLFPDNSYCEEWAYFKGKCHPGQNYTQIGNSNQATPKYAPETNGYR